MSADNYVYIRRESNEAPIFPEACWKGYMESTSLASPSLLEWLFTTNSIQDALAKATVYATEYGCVIEEDVSWRNK